MCAKLGVEEFASARSANSNGFCLAANAVKGVYGVRGAREAVRGGAEDAPVRVGNGVWGTMGERGMERAPGYIVCMRHQNNISKRLRELE